MDQIDWTERIESLKAGSVGALTIASIYSLMTLMHPVLVSQSSELWMDLPVGLLDVKGLAGGAIAALAGFLFGVTYRYIIRGDQNPHLKSGAVLAFGLVRGLAQVDMGLAVQSHSGTLVVLVAESVLLFAIARVMLDVAIAQRWVKPFV